MSDPLQRGSVVLRGRRMSVVWDVTGEELVLLPVFVPERFFRHNVILSLADLVAMGGPPAHSVIRPVREGAVPRAGHDLVGAVPGQTMCRVVHGVVRAIAEAEVELKLLAERRHRQRVFGERCVNMVG